MSHKPLDEVTRRYILALIQANFAGRDDLYAAAEALGNETLSMICRRLADDLASNAIELQQIALAAGLGEVNVNDLGSQLQADLMDVLQEREGDDAVLEEAEECEQVVKQEYDQAIERSDGDFEAVLRRQRENVDFGESVVRGLRASGPEREQQ